MSDFIQSLRRLVHSPAFKFFLIAFLILVLLVPMLLVVGLVNERQGRAREVQNSIARTWGGAQQLSGPFLIVPYSVRVVTMEGDKRVEQTVEKRALFTPEALDITADMASKVLHRGIYEAPTYTAKIRITGRFLTPDLSEIVADSLAVRWHDAVLVLGIADVSGLKASAVLNINDWAEVPFAPSLGIPGLRGDGIHAKLLAAGPAVLPSPDVSPQPFAFTLDLVLAGSSLLQFAPAARVTHVAMTSDWPDPSFSGAFLPTLRAVSRSGFKAEWTVPHLARSVPQAWSLSEQGLERFEPYLFGVSQFQPIGFYDLVTRAVKYDALFVSFAFMAVFVLELLSGVRVHPVQYLFVGIALTFFYVLLLSLSEHTGFGISYAVAAAATGGMLSVYVARSLGSSRSGLIMAAVFAVLFSLLYLILRLEDYALLAGALFGFLTLTVVMFATLGVDWSGSSSQPQPEGALPQRM